MKIDNSRIQGPASAGSPPPSVAKSVDNTPQAGGLSPEDIQKLIKALQALLEKQTAGPSQDSTDEGGPSGPGRKSHAGHANRHHGGPEQANEAQMANFNQNSFNQGNFGGQAANRG